MVKFLIADEVVDTGLHSLQHESLVLPAFFGRSQIRM
jgi:hypothetical protein